MRIILLCLLLTPSLRADPTVTEFRPYNHAGATARLRAALHQEQRPDSPPPFNQSPRPSRFTRQKQRASTSTYFVPPKGFADCSDGSCRR